MELVLIAAVSKDSEGRLVIGKSGKIPWFEDNEIRKPDMKMFKDRTLNHVVIMGRSTFESIGNPLFDRTNIVLTRNPNFYFQGVYSAKTIHEAIKKADILSNKDVYIIGGSQVYEQTLPLANRLEITYVNQEYEGDTYFPNIDQKDWKESFRQKRGLIDFVTYTRI